MHHHQKPWKPSPAAKPSHLTSPAASSPVQSLAALQGATSAFAARPKTATSTVSQLRGQYEAQPVPETPDTPRGRLPAQREDGGTHQDLHRSPSRGRHLSPEHAIIAGARSAVSSASPPSLSQLDRTPSMIAARLVSASPSPVRGSPASSPQNRSSAAIARADEMSEGTTDSNVYSKFNAPIPGSSQPNPQTAKPVASIKTLDLDTMPRLAPKQTNQSMDSNPSASMALSRPTSSSVPIPIPVAKQNMQSILGDDEHIPVSAPGWSSGRSKPPAPAPRKGRTLVRSPLQADLTGSKQFQGMSREAVINRMADAMVASSLASTRTSSPAKPSQAQSPGLQRSASAHNVYRIPPAEPVALPTHYKPQKPMKQTLRKASPEEEDSIEPTKRGRRHLVRKHPNMHHEGDRKRWRDTVSETERRRYEGVFAANRGLLLKPANPRTSPSRLVDPSSETNQVVNVIVRDIWERSRLPAHILEQVYDLVAPDDSMLLNREQFVVGLWLIDQKLKGRKLPVKVSESVWESVRHAQGIKFGAQSY